MKKPASSDSNPVFSGPRARKAPGRYDTPFFKKLKYYYRHGFLSREFVCEI
jgi:hypothetical protein